MHGDPIGGTTAGDRNATLLLRLTTTPCDDRTQYTDGVLVDRITNDGRVVLGNGERHLAMNTTTLSDNPHPPYNYHWVFDVPASFNGRD